MTNELALWPLGKEGMLVPFTVEEEEAGEGGELWPVCSLCQEP